MYIFICIEKFPANVLQTRYDNNIRKCLGENYFESKAFKNFMTSFGIFVFLFNYAIPNTLFVILYGKTITTIRRRKETRDNTNQPSRILEIADQQVTKSAIAVTILFSVCIGFGSWCYFLNRSVIITYEKGTGLSVLGAFLALFNSCANPFVYCASFPIFRKSLTKTFRLGNARVHGNSKGTDYSNAATSLKEETRAIRPSAL